MELSITWDTIRYTATQEHLSIVFGNGRFITHSREPSICPYPEPYYFSPCHNIPSLPNSSEYDGTTHAPQLNHVIMLGEVHVSWRLTYIIFSVLSGPGCQNLKLLCLKLPQWWLWRILSSATQLCGFWWKLSYTLPDLYWFLACLTTRPWRDIASLRNVVWLS